jgi:double-stranded uracil-DNA glycosylase
VGRTVTELVRRDRFIPWVNQLAVDSNRGYPVHRNHLVRLGPRDDGVVAARFSRAQLLAFEGATVDDLLGAQPKLLFAGINPGLWTAAANAHFARPGNRFWPALYRGGVTPHLVDVSGGMTAADHQMVIDLGIGITNLVSIASARADELNVAQLREGGVRLTELVRCVRPNVVAMLGITSYRQAFNLPATKVGRQTDDLAGVELWVLPNPSGLNAHETIDSLATAYAEVARAAGVI